MRSPFFITETVRASGQAGDRRCGVVWHTQGSGKSLAMTYYAGRIISDPRMENPTLVVLTDRSDGRQERRYWHILQLGTDDVDLCEWLIV